MRTLRAIVADTGLAWRTPWPRGRSGRQAGLAAGTSQPASHSASRHGTSAAGGQCSGLSRAQAIERPRGLATAAIDDNDERAPVFDDARMIRPPHAPARENASA